ncbi:MAG: HlyD family type I secretion periplasmic adaptor subunit [Alphaproteobacteria bacterium]|nr:HlyD family type I secretion periplasmic adaptor subunit [Alphaproteobacteria bacterium]
MSKPEIRGWASVGLTTVVVALGGFLAWSATAPLAGGAVADGIVRVAGHRKEIRHKDGGLIAEILVRDGEAVRAGQALLRLDDVDARALVDLLQGQRDAVLAREARLIAEATGAHSIDFPADLTARAALSPVGEILAGQRGIFTSRRNALDQERIILSRRLDQQRSMIASFDAQLDAARRQVDLLTEERGAIEGLVARGLSPKPRLLSLSREIADRQGTIGDLLGRIVTANEAVAEAETRLAALDMGRDQDVALEIRATQEERVGLEEKLRSARAQLARTEIRAPRAGTVLGLRHHTVGGVVAPGDMLLELVPSDATLLVEARIRPVDIGSVQAGSAAKIRLAAANRDTPVLDGRVLTVAADVLSDERTGQTFYAAQVEVAPPPGLSLQPGMPVSVMVAAEARTLFGYLIRPISDSFFRAFAEH